MRRRLDTVLQVGLQRRRSQRVHPAAAAQGWWPWIWDRSSGVVSSHRPTPRNRYNVCVCASDESRLRSWFGVVARRHWAPVLHSTASKRDTNQSCIHLLWYSPHPSSSLSYHVKQLEPLSTSVHGRAEPTKYARRHCAKITEKNSENRGWFHGPKCWILWAIIHCGSGVNSFARKTQLPAPVSIVLSPGFVRIVHVVAIRWLGWSRDYRVASCSGNLELASRRGLDVHRQLVAIAYNFQL